MDNQIPKGVLPDEVQVFNPEGELVAIPSSQAHEAQSMGFTVATPEQAHQYLNEQKYGTGTQQAITFAEGAAKGATFGLSSAVERGLGVNPEDILAREETNPGSAMVGEGAGIVGSMFIPVAGAGNIAARAGEGAAMAAAKVAPRLVGEANVIAKVGSAAVKGAVENAIFTAGDEVSKAILKDPNQTFQTALTDIGLSSVIGAGAGGAFGAVNPLWEATAGSRLKPLLQAIQDRGNGLSTPVSGEIDNAAAILAKDIAPEVRALYSSNPSIKSRAQELIESGTESGEAVRAALAEHVSSLEEKAKNIFAGAADKSEAELGSLAADQINTKIETAQKSFNERYEALTPTEKSITVADSDRLKLYDEVRDLAFRVEELGLGAPNGPVQKTIENFANRVVEPETLKGFDLLKRELADLRTQAYRSGDNGVYQGYKHLDELLTDFQDRQVAKAAKAIEAEGFEHGSAMGRDIVRERKELRQQYSEHLGEIREIADLAGLGSGARTAGRVEAALEGKSSEGLARSLFRLNDEKRLAKFEKVLPEAYATFKSARKRDIYSASLDSHGELSLTKLFNKIENLPKEMKARLFSREEIGELEAVRTLRAALPERLNPSGTARTLDSLWRHAPAGAGGLVGVITGHGPLSGVLLGEVSRYASRDLPDAVKLSLLKFLGSSGPVDASAWKTAADLIERVYKGQKLVEKATKAVFQAGKAVLPDALYPDEKKVQKLDKKLKELAQNPEPLFDIGGKTAHYMPEHAQSMGQTAANAVNWINEQRPKAPQMGILDSPAAIPKEVEDHYHRTLQIAEQPLVALQHLKDGTLQPSDVQTVQVLYPELYQKLSQGLVSELIEAKTNGEPLPYKMTLGLSMFLAQPLDGTMTPEGIQALQSTYSPQEVQQPNSPQGPKGSLKALADLPGQHMTPGQKREASHSV